MNDIDRGTAMKVKTGRLTVLLVAVGVLAAALAAQAQTTMPDSGNSELVAKQRFTREQFIKFTTKMLEAAKMLEKSDPETAKAIIAAVNHAQAAFVDSDMEKVAKYLQEGLTSLAGQTEESVVKELQEMLKVLRMGILNTDERAARLENWKKQLENLKDILNEEKSLERSSDLATHADEIGREMAAIEQELRDVIAEQKNLIAASDKLGPPSEHVKKLSDLREELRELILRQQRLIEAVENSTVAKLMIVGEAQERLSEKADEMQAKLVAAAGDEALAKALLDVQIAADKLAEAGKNVGMASGEMKNAAESLKKSSGEGAADPQEQAVIDLKAALVILDEAISKAVEGTPADNAQKRQEELSKRTGELAKRINGVAGKAGMEPDTGNLMKAIDEMDQAADKLGSQDGEGASKHQKEAVKQLEDDQPKLAQLKRKVIDKANEPKDKQAKDQDDLSDKTGKLSEQMKGEKDSDSTPGQSSVKNAGENMKSASGKLSQGDSGEANKDQKRAIEELERAEKSLQEAIADEQDRMQAESLQKIDDLLQKILKSQQTITKETKETYVKRTGPEKYERSEQVKLTELSRGEGRLSDDVKVVLEMLMKEGSTVVFPEVLKQVQEDLQEVQKLLSENKADELTQAMQEDIERSLQDMIDAIRKELTNRRKQQGISDPGRGGGGGGALVPPLAELKLLYMMQLQIKRRTEALNKQVNEKTINETESARYHRQLAERQKNVTKMTNDMKMKLQGDRPGSGGDDGGF